MVANEFWIYYPTNLINSIDIVPHPYMTLGEKLNALTRLWTLICLAASFFSIKYIEIYWLIGTLILILFYFRNKNMTKEEFSPCLATPSSNSKYFPVTTCKDAPSFITDIPIFDNDWAIPHVRRTGINESLPKHFNGHINPSDYNPSLCGSTIDLPDCLIDPCMMYSLNINTATPQPGEKANVGVTYPQPLSTNMGIVTADFAPPVKRPITLIDGEFPNIPSIGPENVYDPRSNGYGDDRRSYIHELTGQRRYFYKDIDQYRSGLTEINSDINRLVTYDTTDLNEKQKLSSAAFIDISNEHRKNLQETFMSKYNEMIRQRRMMPIRTYG